MYTYNNDNYDSNVFSISPECTPLSKACIVNDTKYQETQK